MNPETERRKVRITTDAPVKKIAVFRALNLGDLLCSIPAMRALRSAYPQADVTLIGLPAMADIARRFPRYFDAFTSFPGIPGLPEQAFDSDAFLRFVKREREAEYDLVLQMHGKGSITNPLICMLGARKCAGYYEEGEFCPDSSTFMSYPEGIPEVRRHLKLMHFLGVGTSGEALEFPIAENEWAKLDALAVTHGFAASSYVCIHPGARDVRRWWAPAKFARIADSLAERGFRILFTGTDHESHAVDRVRERMRHDAVNLAGKTDIGTLGALIGRARLLVSNDTGVSHIAAALGTPSVVIFIASDPDRWAPLNRSLHHVVLPETSNDLSSVMFRVEQAMNAREPSIGYGTQG